MNKSWIFFFVVVMFVLIFSIESSIPAIQYISKPLLMPFLFLQFSSATRFNASMLKIWIISALFFSWVGDVLLMFVPENGIFFIMGLASFLLAHIFYIIFFHKIRVAERIKGNLWLLLIVVIYYAVLIAFLSPYLGDLKFPVRIYGIVISIMFMLAMHMLFIKNKKAGRLMMLGALLFILSDSILAIDKFFQSFDGAGSLIIITYCFGQFCIITGAVNYIKLQEEI